MPKDNIIVLEIDNFGRYLIKMAFKKSVTVHAKPSKMESFITESIYLAKNCHPDDTNRMAEFLVNKMSQNYGDYGTRYNIIAALNYKPRLQIDIYMV